MYVSPGPASPGACLFFPVDLDVRRPISALLPRLRRPPFFVFFSAFSRFYSRSASFPVF